MKVCCCEAAPFGNHCSACEVGAHNACTRPAEVPVPPAPDILAEIAVAADRAPKPPEAREPTIQPLRRPVEDEEPRVEGVWVALNYDMSEVLLFDSEVPALRYAVRNSMHVELIPYGVGIREYINRKDSTDE